MRWGKRHFVAVWLTVATAVSGMSPVWGMTAVSEKPPEWGTSVLTALPVAPASASLHMGGVGAEQSELVSRMKRAASFILSRQDEHGAMNESGFINTDSNMLYAIIGLVAAYDVTGTEEYLRAAEQGMRWLASMQNPEGDWHLSYQRRGERYVPGLPPSYSLLAAVRGVDTTMALFLYAAEQVSVRSRDDTLKHSLKEASRRAYRFLVMHSRDPADGLFWSSYHLPRWKKADPLPPLSAYRRFAVKYAADNAETYAGLAAYARLTGDRQARELAEQLQRSFVRFFDDRTGRFAVMVDEYGKRSMQPAYARVFATGWPAWLMGADADRFVRSRAALTGELDQDGSFPGGYALSSLAFLLGEQRAAVASVRTGEARRYLFSLQGDNGGLADDPASGSTYVNIAGLFLLYLAGECRSICSPFVH